MFLPHGIELHGRYRIEEVLGHGGFGITYLAMDQLLNVRVAIKEYFPRQLATRAEGATKITIFTGEAREHYLYGLKKFIEEAQALARFGDHPNIVSCRDFFEANGTAYMVMPYLEGLTLKDYLAQKGGRLPYEAARDILFPVMDALREVHSVHLLHRDISPDNIFLTTARQVKLIDFGAARYQAGEHSKSLSVILKTGYAPEEQYRSSGRQGPWTDVYAVAATLYKAVTGQTPPDALDRLAHDTLVPPSQLGVPIPPQAEQALLKALAVKAAHRFQTIQDFQAALLGMAPVTVSPAAPQSEILAPAVEIFEPTQPVGPVALSRPLPAAVPPLQVQVPRRSWSPLAILAPAFALVGIILVAILVWQGIKAPQAPQPDREARHYLKQGIKSYNTGNTEGFKDALRAFEKAVELKPDLYMAQYYLGLTQNQFSTNQDAEAAFSRAIELKPDFAEAHYHLGLTYIALGKPEAAREQCNVLKKLNEDLAKKLYLELAHHPSPPPPTKPPELKPKMDLAVLKNSRYYIDDLNEWITLNDGKYERGNSPINNSNFLRVNFQKAAFGYLDNKDREDAAVIYSYNGGGSGTFYRLAAMINKDGKAHNISSTSLGDRVIINSLNIISGKISIDMTTHGPRDPMARPTLRKAVKYELVENELVLVQSSERTRVMRRAPRPEQETRPEPESPEDPFTFPEGHREIRTR